MESRDSVGVVPARQNLQRLVWLRYLLTGVTAIGIAVAYLWSVPMRSIAPLLWVAAVLLGLNVATQFRLRLTQRVGNRELFLQLIADVALWAVLVAWISDASDVHLFARWATFVLGALLIAFLLERMASAIRDRDRQLASKREEQLRNERIVALGTMAAGAAHELGTPLTTMAVIVGDMEGDFDSRDALRADIRMLRTQIGECKRIISELVVAAGSARAEEAAPLHLDDYLDQVIAKWQVVRPGVACQYARRGALPVPSIVAEQTVSQAIMSLLNNAADASPHSVQIEGEWNRDKLRVEIRDRGPGLTREAKLRAGEPFFSTKPPGYGIGIGLFLANATIERFGGKVGISNREGGGACTLIELPLARLSAEAAA